MADGLSQDEKDTLMKVMERAKEFDQANKEGRLQTPTEGLLYKWTNPLKGWQPRWFYVNHEQGVLHYCMSEEKRKQPPRASLHLWGAVVSPSDEDSQSFSVQGANNECYRLKAANAKERQSWVSKMRLEVEHASNLAATSKDLSSDRSSTSVPSTPQSHGNSNNATPSKKHGRKSQLSAPLNLSLTKLSNKKRHRRLVHDGGAGVDSTTVFPGGDDMLDALTRLQSLQEKLIDQLETCATDIGVAPENKDVLILKATSQAGVLSIQDTLALLNVQMGLPTSTGGSPVHTALSPINAQSPRRVPGRHKRPMSMIDTSSSRQRQYQEVENDLDDLVTRSTSVSDIGTRRVKVVPEVKYKEAP